MYSKYYSPRSFRYLAMIIMAALCLLLDFLTKISFNRIELPKDKPEYNASGVDGMVYNARGKLLYRVKSVTAWKFPLDERIFMQGIHAYMYNESVDTIKYELTSNSGWVNNEEQIGLLGNDTVLTIPNPNPLEVVTLYGSQIKLDLNKRLVVSDAPVKAVKNHIVVDSKGFVYDYGKELLTLNTKVKVVYDK